MWPDMQLKQTKLKLTETTLNIITTLKTLSETHSNNTKTNTNQTNEQPQPQMNKWKQNHHQCNERWTDTKRLFCMTRCSSYNSWSSSERVAWLVLFWCAAVGSSLASPTTILAKVGCEEHRAFHLLRSDGGEGRTRSHRSICHLVILLEKTKSIDLLSTNWLHEVELHLRKKRQLQDIIMHHCAFATNRIKGSASV